MQTLRAARLLARLVLVWFALSLGAAIASPLVQPRAMELVCSAGGAVKLLVKNEDGAGERSALSLDCSLCPAPAAPPPAAGLAAEPPQPLSHGLGRLPEARIAWLTAAPLPARGPPGL